MGYHFTPQVNGQVTALGGYFNGTKTVKLFNKATGTLLASASVTGANVWAYTSITPITVMAGTTYTVAVYLAGSGGSYRYSLSPTFPRTFGDIRIEGSTYVSTATSQISVPTNIIATTMYGQADIQFVPATTDTTPPTGTISINNKTMVKNLNAEYLQGKTPADFVAGVATTVAGNHEQDPQTRKNLIWLGKNAELFAHDATRISEKVKGVDAIVTEPDLGPRIDLEKLYINCFNDWRKVLKPEGLVVIALPFVKNVLDKAQSMGYTLVGGPYLYARPQAIIKRNICIFRLK